MADIYATGEIVADDDKWFYDWMEISCICPSDVKTAVNSADEDVTLYIDSPGGDVSAASTIRSILLSCGKKTKAVIIGMAASAATIIMTGCETVEAYNTAILMIHKAKNMLDAVDSSIANAYVEKTGKSKNEILKLMGKTTWMDVDKALKDGFIDKIIDGQPDEELKATASFKGFNISKGIKEKVIAFKNQGIKPFNDGASVPQKVDTNAIAELVIKRLEDKQKQAELNSLKEFSVRMEGKYD